MEFGVTGCIVYVFGRKKYFNFCAVFGEVIDKDKRWEPEYMKGGGRNNNYKRLHLYTLVNRPHTSSSI